MRNALVRLLAAVAVVFYATAALAVRADLVTVKDLLAQPEKWHGRPVVVSGGVAKLEARTSQRGNAYYTFVLTDGLGSVNVFAYGVPEVKEGDHVQVEGTFLKVKRVGQYVFQNQVDARRIRVL